MIVNFAEVKAIAEVLPIGIYAKRRIRCSLSEDEDTSFYSPVEDEIVISFPQVSTALAHTPDDEDKEVAIRSMLYHEVSHAILTGKDVVVTPQFNIFEDERIETILNNFYLDVDFAKQVYRINGIESNADLPDPTSAMDAFYQLVRFHKGDADLLDKVQEIIRKYAGLSQTISYASGGVSWWRYKCDIDNLYEEVKRRFGEDTSSTSADSSAGKAGTEGTKTPISEKEILDILKKLAEDGEIEIGSGDGDGEIGTNSLEKVFCDNVSPTYNEATYTQLSAIISNFNKRNHSGSAVGGYSGVFNPRATAREDYKYFERKASINGANKFGTFHLNLFLDNSGSFSPNQAIVNGILGALRRLEKTNHNFSFDVVHCGCGEELITDKAKCGLTCCDGTSLDYEAITLYRKLQKPNTYNYNIILYDGSCYDCRYKDAFKAFNYNNCTIISDPENEREINKYAPNAKRIITKDYTENLLSNILATIARAFR